VRSATQNIGSWLPRRAEISSDRIAVIDPDRTLGYPDLEDRTARCAAILEDAGIGPGERVAILLGNRSAYLEAVFAAARLGAIAVPVNLRWVVPEIARLLDDCTPRALLYEHELATTVEKSCSAAADPPSFRLPVGGAPDRYEQALASASPHRDIAPVSPDDPLLLAYTSGTTGAPKGALLPHRKTLYNSLNAALFFELTARDRVLVVVPLFHSFGLNILSIPTLFAGGTAVLQGRFDPERVWDAVGEHRITFFGGVPTMFRALEEALASAPKGRFELGSLRFLFTAGAAIPVERIRSFEARGLVLKQGFGQTETSILCCLDARDAIRKAGSVGRPVLHSEVKVFSSGSLEGPTRAWRQVAPGETGEIAVRGPITMLGYWRRPEANAETLRDGWLRTGDLASVDEEGFVTLVGRARDMYISGGENVYPAEVEAAYLEHPDVREIAVVGVPDDHWGEIGCAYVALEEGARLDSDALRAWAGERLAAFKIPQRFEAIEQLPRTATGKVRKFELRERTARRATRGS
jgi:fatty-acyl-CoA synthase